MKHAIMLATFSLSVNAAEYRLLSGCYCDAARAMVLRKRINPFPTMPMLE
ncbi:MAG: hypothetical protein ACRC46_09525 [Thermoguttaceae bacterium]